MKKLNVKGPIISNGEKWIYEWFGEDATCPNDIIKELPEDGSEVNIQINSGGGYVDSGNEIFTALKLYPGQVTVDIIKAASAASVIAMAGDTVRITPVGQIMIHNASTRAAGDHQVMNKTEEILKKTDRSIVTAYQLKTGLSREELLGMMDAETWMTAEEAKEKGFVDEILFENENGQIIAAADENGLLPSNVIKRMQNMKREKKLDNQESKGTENLMKRFFFC